MALLDDETYIKRQTYWENLFQTKDHTQVLWHQSSPEKSLELISRYSKKEDALIDVGCGASLLVDRLLEEGCGNITLLDTSKTSLEIVKKRVKSNGVTYLCDDVLNFKSAQKFALWHDRAVFHFLTGKKERESYFDVLADSLKEGGTAIISTFRVGGPLQCAGLDIVQYDHQKMLQELPMELKLLESQEYMHITPKNSEQEYIYFIIQKEGYTF